MPWKVLEDDTMCQTAERNPGKAFEDVTTRAQSRALKEPPGGQRLSHCDSLTCPCPRPDLRFATCDEDECTLLPLSWSLIFCLEPG